MDNHEALKIDFLDSLKTGDKRLIEKYSIEQLRMSLAHFHLVDQRQPWHQEIVRRIEELQRKEEKKQDQSKINKKEPEFIAIAIFIFAVLATIFTYAQLLIPMYQQTSPELFKHPFKCGFILSLVSAFGVGLCFFTCFLAYKLVIRILKKKNIIMKND